MIYAKLERINMQPDPINKTIDINTIISQEVQINARVNQHILSDPTSAYRIILDELQEEVLTEFGKNKILDEVIKLLHTSIVKNQFEYITLIRQIEDFVDKHTKNDVILNNNYIIHDALFNTNYVQHFRKYKHNLI